MAGDAPRRLPFLVAIAALSYGLYRSSHLDQLRKLSKLRESGTLTADEFEAEKARIMQSRT